jgi:hypothetical protein
MWCEESHLKIVSELENILLKFSATEKNLIRCIFNGEHLDNQNIVESRANHANFKLGTDDCSLLPSQACSLSSLKILNVVMQNQESKICVRFQIFK